MSKIITLTTDFGLQDHYVSAMKAVILGVAPEARLIDISHEIPPQDIMAGAWVIRNSAFLFPDHSIHLVVVDPGVGTDRKALILEVNNQYFIGPDNGIFSLLFEEFDYKAYSLNKPIFWRDTPSRTFHGRDIFSPVAAHLANGVAPSKMGDPLRELVSYHWAVPIGDRDGLQGWVIHIDRFGNLITNISEELIEKTIGRRKVRIYVGNTMIDHLVNTFEDVQPGEPAAFVGSSGMMEIGINRGNAAEMLSVDKGTQISLILQR